MEPKEFFTEQEQQEITDAIRGAEETTAGEICVRIERRCEGDPLQRAGDLLHTLGFASTAARTAVLIYISLEDRKVAIYGDQAIHEKIGDDGWKQICNQMVTYFQTGEFFKGVIAAIEQVGSILKMYFPAGVLNPNELPDKPSFG